jgi:hypothetical protein
LGDRRRGQLGEVLPPQRDRGSRGGQGELGDADQEQSQQLQETRLRDHPEIALGDQIRAALEE